MQDRMLVFARVGVLCVLALSGRFVSAQEKAAPSTAQVHVTDASRKPPPQAGCPVVPSSPWS
jgi:hypothetical protein